MGKYCGKIGYGVTKEKSPGVWVNEITERNVFGDVFKNSSKNEKAEGVNDNINVSMQISFLADPYARLNFHLIKYAEFMGAKWKVTTVTEEYPRLFLVLGGVYND